MRFNSLYMDLASFSVYRSTPESKPAKARWGVIKRRIKDSSFFVLSRDISFDDNPGMNVRRVVEEPQDPDDLQLQRKPMGIGARLTREGINFSDIISQLAPCDDQYESELDEDNIDGIECPPLPITPLKIVPPSERLAGAHTRRAQSSNTTSSYNIHLEKAAERRISAFIVNNKKAINRLSRSTYNSSSTEDSFKAFAIEENSPEEDLELIPPRRPQSNSPQRSFQKQRTFSSASATHTSSSNAREMGGKNGVSIREEYCQSARQTSHSDHTAPDNYCESPIRQKHSDSNIRHSLSRQRTSSATSLSHPGSSSRESTHSKYSQSPPRESPTEPYLRENYIEFPVGESYNDPPLRESYNGTIASRSPPPLRRAFSSMTLRHLIKKHNDSSGRERFNNPPLQDIFNDSPGRSSSPEYAISKSTPEIDQEHLMCLPEKGNRSSMARGRSPCSTSLKQDPFPRTSVLQRERSPRPMITEKDRHSRLTIMDQESCSHLMPEDPDIYSHPSMIEPERPTRSMTMDQGNYARSSNFNHGRRSPLPTVVEQVMQRERSPLPGGSSRNVMQQNSGLGSRDQPSKPKRSLADVVSGPKFLLAKIEMQNELQRQFSRYRAK